MTGKVKFDQEAAFKNIIGVGRGYNGETPEKSAVKEKKRDRVQRSYFLDRDIDKALRRMALDKEKNLTETINALLRIGLKEYLE